jgi:hypothetical protein
MNERIKELALQANIDFIYDPTETPMRAFAECWEDELEKFAELIVQECISIVEEQKECLCEEQQYWSDHDYGYEMAVNDASKGIKQFFGVEE